MQTNTEFNHLELLCVKSDLDRFSEGRVYYAEVNEDSVFVFDHDGVCTSIDSSDKNFNEFKLNGCIFV